MCSRLFDRLSSISHVDLHFFSLMRDSTLFFTVHYAIHVQTAEKLRAVNGGEKESKKKVVSLNLITFAPYENGQ